MLRTHLSNGSLAFMLATVLLAGSHGAAQDASRTRRQQYQLQTTEQPKQTVAKPVSPTPIMTVLRPDYTISSGPNGGECLKFGTDYAQATKSTGIFTTWDDAAKECRTVNMALNEGKRLSILSGASLRVIAQFSLLGKIENHGKLMIGGFPQKNASGVTVGGTIHVFPQGILQNKPGSSFSCYTNSYITNDGSIINSGSFDMDCHFEQYGSLENLATMVIDQGTMKPNGYPDRTIYDGQYFLTDQRATVSNQGTIIQGVYTSVVNRGTIQNLGYYQRRGGDYRNWGHFYNICNGVAENLAVAEGRPLEQRPCN